MIRIAILLLIANVAFAQHEWTYPENGIAKTIIGEDVWVFKIDQKKMGFYAKGSNTERKTLPEWAKYAAGAINLNMFGLGDLPNGYTKLNSKVIQPNIRRDYNAFIVWDKDTLIIMDRYADGMKKIMSYPNVSQNIRMIVEDSPRNTWQIDSKKWSVSTIATTVDGDVLFIHSRYPYTMHEYIDMLLNANLDIYRMAYLEGGPESQIGIYGHFSRPLKLHQLGNQRMGSYETDFVEHDEINTFWEIPWVLCFERK